MEERPETEKRPESGPTSLDDGEEAPLDEPSQLEQLHGVPSDPAPDDRDDAA
jgi:hypothetical protein